MEGKQKKAQRSLVSCDHIGKQEADSHAVRTANDGKLDGAWGTRLRFRI